MPLFVALPAKRESLLLHLRTERVGSIQEHRRVGFSFKAERADRPPVIDECSYPCFVILEDGGLLPQRGRTDPRLGAYRFPETLQGHLCGFSWYQEQASKQFPLEEAANRKNSLLVWLPRAVEVCCLLDAGWS